MFIKATQYQELSNTDHGSASGITAGTNPQPKIYMSLKSLLVGLSAKLNFDGTRPIHALMLDLVAMLQYALAIAAKFTDFE